MGERPWCRYRWLILYAEVLACREESVRSHRAHLSLLRLRRKFQRPQDVPSTMDCVSSNCKPKINLWWLLARYLVTAVRKGLHHLRLGMSQKCHMQEV